MNVSISRRLALMFAACGLVVFLLFSITLRMSLCNALARHERSELLTRAEVHEPQIRRADDTDRWGRFQDKLESMTPPDGSTRYWVLSADPRFSFNTWPAGVSLPPLDRSGFGRVLLPGEQKPRALLLREFPGNGPRPAVRLIVAMDRTPFRQTLRSFTVGLIGLSIAGIVLVAGLGYLIARFGLQPLRRLAADAQQLSPSKLSQRLGGGSLPPELAQLAGAFNGALDRLELAYQQLEAFNTDVAHELRTPLSNLIGQTQVALSRERSQAELEEVLQSNLEELNRLRSIVHDMLFLTRADSGETARGRIETSLAQEVRRTLDFLDMLFDEAGVRTRIDGDARLPVDPALFCRAISNLLVNAVQHTAAGGEVRVEIAGTDDGAVRVAVSNPGAPIAAEQLPRLFDRFYRLDTARSSSGDNHGLGLAIVKAIVRMHGGSGFARSEHGINSFGFTLPVAH